MKRALLVSVSVAVLGWMAGCGGGGSSSGGGITSTQPNNFKGQYAFVLTGFDSSGSPMGMAGSVTADGLGHITAGEVDVNDDGVVSSNSSLSGSYSFDANGNSTLGVISLGTTIGTISHPLAFGFSLRNSGDFGEIMTVDSNNFVTTGTMQLQSASVFPLSGMAGDYAVTLNGRNATPNPISAIGRFTLAADGTTSNTAFDRSIAGVGTAGPTVGALATATFAAAGGDANGRGTFTLDLNDGLATAVTQQFAYYAISKARFVAVQIGTTAPTAPLTADFSGQSTPFTASTVVGTGVFGMAGIDTTAVPANEISAVGQLQVVSGTPPTGTLQWDANDVGTPFGPASSAGQTVTFDPNTGRGTVPVTSGNAHGLADSEVFYVIAPGSGFILDATTGAANRAMAGIMMPQAAGPYSASTDLGGLAILRAAGSSVNDAFSAVGLFGPVQGQSNDYELLFDLRQPNNGSIQTQTDVPDPGISVVTLDANVGRTTLLFTNGATEVLYIIGPNQFYLIDISPVGSQVNGPSGVFFASPQ